MEDRLSLTRSPLRRTGDLRQAQDLPRRVSVQGRFPAEAGAVAG